MTQLECIRDAANNNLDIVTEVENFILAENETETIAIGYSYDGIDNIWIKNQIR